MEESSRIIFWDFYFALQIARIGFPLVFAVHRYVGCFLAGGFAKAPDLLPDLLHSFYSVAWLSLSQELEAEEIDVSLGITKRARALLPL